MKAWLPSSHEWVDREAKKEKKKGWASGGMLLGKGKGWGGRGGELALQKGEGTNDLKN